MRLISTSSCVLVLTIALAVTFTILVYVGRNTLGLQGLVFFNGPSFGHAFLFTILTYQTILIRTDRKAVISILITASFWFFAGVIFEYIQLYENSFYVGIFDENDIVATGLGAYSAAIVLLNLRKWGSYGGRSVYS